MYGELGTPGSPFLPFSFYPSHIFSLSLSLSRPYPIFLFIYLFIIHFHILPFRYLGRRSFVALRRLPRSPTLALLLFFFPAD